MIRTAADVNRMANLLAMKIEQRRSDIRKHTDYVRGKRGTLKFASDEFKRYMSDRFSGFADNWCLPVAQAPVERIHFRGFIPYGDVELDSHVMRVWERNDCDRKLQETALMMTTTGRAFGLVTSMPDGRARISFEHPDSAAVHYDPLTGEVDAGLLVRYDEEHEFGTLLLPDVVFDVVRVRAGGDDERDRLPPGVDVDHVIVVRRTGANVAMDPLRDVWYDAAREMVTGNPTAANAAATASEIVTDADAIFSYAAASARRSVVSPAVTAIGFPERVPAW